MKATKIFYLEGLHLDHQVRNSIHFNERRFISLKHNGQILVVLSENNTLLKKNLLDEKDKYSHNVDNFWIKNNELTL